MTLVYVLYAHPFKKIGEEVLHALYLCCHSLTLWCTTVHTKSESGSECCCAFVSTNREKGRWLWQNVNQTSLHLNSGYERITEADRQHFHWSGIKLFDTIWGKKSKAGSCMMKICVLWLRCFLARLFHEHRVCAVLVWQHCLRRDKKKNCQEKAEEEDLLSVLFVLSLWELSILETMCWLVWVFTFQAHIWKIIYPFCPTKAICAWLEKNHISI